MARKQVRIDAGRAARLDAVMSDIGATPVLYGACDNPSCVDMTFRVPGSEDGEHMAGTGYFDFRKRCVESLERRGFRILADNQGAMPFNMTLQDTLPEGCEDGEILGLDRDRSIIQWNGDDLETYNCGETPEAFGDDNIRPHERERIRRDADVLDAADRMAAMLRVMTPA